MKGISIQRYWAWKGFGSALATRSAGHTMAAADPEWFRERRRAGNANAAAMAKPMS
jgi:hypothetical protein